MKLLIEEYQYNVADVADILDGLFTLQDVEQRISVSYVGYFYNPHEKVRDVVYILPKVLIDEKGKVFGKYDPTELLHLDAENSPLTDEERKFLYEFAVWVHRAIVVFNDSHADNEIVLHRELENSNHGGKKKKSNTLLDIILALIQFNKENQQFFTFILKNIHSGFNKINWGKTISRTSAIVQEESPVYLNPVNKKRQINFDEELIIIFFSILQYVSDRFGFKVNIGFGFKLITGAQFKRYLEGYGCTRLRQIKYKYFSDTAVKLGNLCYAFFDKAYQIQVNVNQSEYLLVKSFHIVFEAMIDELVGTPHDQIPHGLADQKDGKIVDHLYTYEGLLINGKPDNDIYYIGDSKYYKIGNAPDEESTYKQRTYVRNVIQWNLDLYNDGTPDKNNEWERIELFDSDTEGYAVIPNFFISAQIDRETLSFDDKVEEHPSRNPERPNISRHFKNRLYDRDTLLLSHFDVNFLYVLSLYARNNSASKAAWRESVRRKFRAAVQEMLKKHFDFYAISAHDDVDAAEYFQTHFQQTLGKTFRPFENRKVYSLALDKECKEENEELLASLRENFYVVDCPLGVEPTPKISQEREAVGDVTSPDSRGMAFAVYIAAAHRDLWRKRTAKVYRSRTIPKGNVLRIKYLIPIIDGCIDGYYDVRQISFGLSEPKEGEAPEPRVIFTLGDFTPFGDDWAIVNTNGIRTLSWGQMLPLSDARSIYNEAPKKINYR